MTEVVMKALALVESADTDNPNGGFDVILSAPTLDRDGEVIDSRAFDPLPAHIPFDVDHSMTVTGTVGSGVPYYDDAGNLRVKGTFASTPLGQEVRTLVNEGHIRTTSVTFMAAKRTKDDKDVQHVTQAELLNGTFTPVPSNRESVVLSAKAITAAAEEKVGARNSTADASLIQSAHDAMTALGAACGKSATGETKDADTEDASDPGALAQAVDAAIDEAIDLLAAVDATSLPAEVQQALALIQAADAAVDELLDALGVVDPDEDAQKSTDGTDPVTAEAAAESAKSAADDDLEFQSRFALSLNAARFAFDS